MDLDDFRQPEDVSARSGNKTGSWVLVAAAVVAIGALAGYWWFGRNLDPPPAGNASTEVPLTAERPAARSPLGADVDAIDLPPLDLTDPLVRDLVGALSSRPEVAAWLATDGLIRNFVVSVENMASGRTPAVHLRRLAPRGAFAVEQDRGVTVASAAANARFDGIAETVESLDAADLARIYTLLKPRFEEAYAELGGPAQGFDAAFERAVVQLLQVDVPPGGARVVARGGNYRYADPDLEALTPAQKQLLRMGPGNARRVQDKMREVAGALGIPDERLPARDN